ncbi:hypothetical protein X739_21900 [Mesorhizobium sp. LNHC220B00]|nr:hypothetical protein X739_21900 [Mesorhizobium sp. LNHC220B00]
MDGLAEQRERIAGPESEARASVRGEDKVRGPEPSPQHPAQVVQNFGSRLQILSISWL